jgi:hypothetical protein
MTVNDIPKYHVLPIPYGHFVTPYNESGKADCHDPLPGHLLPQPLCIMAKDLAVTEEKRLRMTRLLSF